MDELKWKQSAAVFQMNNREEEEEEEQDGTDAPGMCRQPFLMQPLNALNSINKYQILT